MPRRHAALISFTVAERRLSYANRERLCSSGLILHRAPKSFHSDVIDGSHKRYRLIEKEGQGAAAVFRKAH
jgi:hypothetical protein